MEIIQGSPWAIAFLSAATPLRRSQSSFRVIFTDRPTIFLLILQTTAAT